MHTCRTLWDSCSQQRMRSQTCRSLRSQLPHLPVCRIQLLFRRVIGDFRLACIFKMPDASKVQLKNCKIDACNLSDRPLLEGPAHVLAPARALIQDRYSNDFIEVLWCLFISARLRLSSFGFFHTLSALFTSPSAGHLLSLADAVDGWKCDPAEAVPCRIKQLQGRLHG